MPEPTKLVAARSGRADAVVADALGGVSRRRVAALFASGDVRIDGRRARKGDHVEVGAAIELQRLPETDDDRRPAPEPALEAAVIYVDDAFVAIDKPAGWPTHPLAAGEMGTAANWLVAHYPETIGIGDDPREAGFVHRLDRATTGVLIAARHRDAWLHARQAFREHRVEKTYLALVSGVAADGSCNQPLATRGARAVVDAAVGLEAETRWRVAERLVGATLLECQTRSGRMHQVRAHLAFAGHPLVGDDRYGGPASPEGDGAHFLHALRVAWDERTIEAPLPEARRAVIDSFR